MLSSDDPAALDRLAQLELFKSEPDLDAAQNWARQALRSRPLDSLAPLWLGITAERKGDKKTADELIRVAGRRTWRNLNAHLWVFQNDVARKNFTDALLHVDALLRVDPKLYGPIFPRLAVLTTDPRGLKALADFLVTSPPWREWFLASLSNRLYDRSHLDQLYKMLSESKNPPSKRELGAYLNRLIKNERYEFAYRIWRDSLPASLRPTGRFPYNGDFEIPIDGLPFNWIIAPVVGADVAVVSSKDGKGRVLRAQFSGARVQFANVRELMLLSPGHYRLVGRVRSDDLDTTRGLWWRISCVEGSSERSLAQTDLLSGTHPWSDFQVDFEVPPTGCKVQRLRLELPARVASEHQIEGQVWYRDLRITPIPAPSTG